MIVGTINFYALLLIVIILISGISFNRSFRRNGRGYFLLSAFCFSMIIICLGVLASLFVIGYDKLITFAFSHIGYATIPVLCVLFALYYTGYKKYLNIKHVLAIAFIPIVSILIYFINCVYPILGTFFVLGNGNLVTNWNTLYMLLFIYPALLGFASIALYIKELVKTSGSKVHLVLLILAVASAIFGEIFNLIVAPPFDISTIGYLFSLIFVQWAVLGYDIFNESEVHKEFINYVNAGMMYFNADDELVDFNNLAEYTLGLDKTALHVKIDDLFPYYPKFLNFFHSDKMFCEFKLPNLHYGDLMASVTSRNLVHSTNYAIELEDVWFNCHKRVFFNGNKFLGTLITFYDVTAYVNSAYEKELLLKEIHHRVKNNLQIILSLLNLDYRFHPDDPDVVIDNIRNRVQSIALIHTKIYNSDNLASVDVGSYLEDILNYMSNLKPEKVNFNIDYEKMDGTLEYCIPLGLVLIELVNNSLKYAFPNKEGNIFVKLYKEGDISNLLIYDDGVGIPEGVDIFNSPSLGLTVVKDLISQIDGTFGEYKCDGSGFRITFDLSKEL